MRIGVIGAGAIGGAIAALLDRAGHEVEVTARGATLAAIDSAGLRLDGKWGEHTARVTAAGALTRTPELAFLATKAQDAASALELNRDRLAGVPLVVVQNGLEGLETVRRVSPRSPAFGALALYAAQNVEPGRVTITATGTTVVDRSREAAALLASVMPAQVTDNFRGAQWTKLVINMVNGTPAATGLPVQQTVADARLRPIVTGLIREASRVGLAHGVRFDAMQGLSHAGVRFAATAPLWAGQLLPRLMARRMGAVPNLGSTLQSIRRGQRTEIDYLNGAVVAQAEQVGLRAPVNQTVTAAVHAVEDSGRFFSPDELAELVRAASASSSQS
ncbi:ketopantoate reductase family protein [Gryllotalpicola protaetiae]|uniref:2-dehydropantoate 2-reductase n=1 Tax=Gryllotalpicola protaetiae TaxID=2419771 RepID=A0A387BKT5_9MICO|nr:2-dehydropantoate 2-reductase [Gryllotalpicola protaetiae]AYG04483.1 2-dehydropantoate 2-reductase [Gryllotalpicola protaetiae]